MGLKDTVCQETCDSWFHACKDQFFSYGQMSAKLVPCRDGDDAPVICTRLADMAEDGEEFCKFMGMFMVWEGDLLFDVSCGLRK